MAPVDTATLVALAELKRDLIRERELAGLAAGRARGRQGGRKSSLTPDMIKRAQAAMRRPRHERHRTCAAELGTSTKVLYRHVTPEGELTEVGERALGKSKEDAA